MTGDDTRLAARPDDDADVTRTTAAPPTPASSVPGAPGAPSGAGWLSTSGAIDHGRFSPGDVLEGRYRIVGLLGRGGMGEVYRADDLRLGQPVAIKFLPAGLHADTRRLAQFHNEVRMARQVSHPNVCRVHDIGEVQTPAGAQLFITMEFIDGEDLAASLKRVGRFPEDRALDLARQIAAGLAAAHDRGVIHRDLKPANIMLDRQGQVRLMDFGLAAAGVADDVQSGTPAYMAPEQLVGKEVTAKSDLFALGLVLYELFTGQRAFSARTIADLVTQQEAGVSSLPAELVKGLDPAIENAILWCLRRDPAARPPSALALSAALPGSDPLAAALAAGETPSPEMVAAAGRDDATLSSVAAASWLVATVILLLVAALAADRALITAKVPLERAMATQADHARDVARTLGYDDGVVDRASGYVEASNVLQWIHASQPGQQAARLANATPPPLMFWYRASTAPIVPDGVTASMFDPAVATSGETMMAFGTTGRLFRLIHVPRDTGPARPPVDWAAIIALAGFDPARFAPADPQWTPPVYADTRVAFAGTLPELPGIDVRIEAASARGTVTSFRVFGPWNPLPSAGGAAPVAPASSVSVIAAVSTVIIVPGMMLVGALVARRNIRLGRGDRAGAAFLFFLSLSVSLVAWLFQAHHVPSASIEVNRFFGAVGRALFDAAVLWLFYLAAEPQVRRVWPHILITWSRLVSRGPGDARVGRDLLMGAALGLVMTVVSHAFFAMPALAGLPDMLPHTPLLDALGDTRLVLAAVPLRLSAALQNALLGVLGLAVLRMVLRRTWLVFAVATLLFTPLAARGQFQSGVLWLDLAFGLMLVALILGVIIRLGLVAGIAAFFVHFWTFAMPLTLSPSRLYFQTSLFALGVVVALAAAGWWLVRQPPGSSRRHA